MRRAPKERGLLLFACVLLSLLKDASAACVRYECALTFEEYMKDGQMKDKAVLTCENYPFNRCGPGEAECGGHCLNHPGHECDDNSDCDDLDTKPVPAPPAPAPGPIYIPVPVGFLYPNQPEATSGVCWHVAWPVKEECERMGGDIPGQCYASEIACSRNGGEEFLPDLCGGADCGCCLWGRESEGPPKVPKDHSWPTPQPSFCCPEFVEVAKSNLQLFLLLFLLYIVFNAAVILLSRWLIRRRARFQAASQQQGSYSGIEGGAPGEDGDDDQSDEDDDPEMAEAKRRRRKQRRNGVMWDDCCGDFEWWECSAWVRYAAWLFVEALVLPCVLCFLCFNGGGSEPRG
mmetsp:Transcript_19426/g.35199  ORF Transcript_19426/g.35199 Transcript_19426/m.35199 type:complete len:346 (-) Transcript_19426:107-1144(-)